MSLKFNEPKLNFVITQDETLKLIKETYPGQLEITVNERISDWQAAKKIYHAGDFGLNPEDTKMTKDQYLVRFEIIRVFSFKSVTKTFYIREFFNSHKVSNKGICEMKQIFIQLGQELNQFDLIESKVNLMLHGSNVEVPNLTTFNISIYYL